MLAQRTSHAAAVIGGGFIGLEMAENCSGGPQVSLIEALDQVMAPLDFEMAQLVHENMVQNGVQLCWATAWPPLPATTAP